jgi:hypothetical protein
MQGSLRNQNKDDCVLKIWIKSCGLNSPVTRRRPVTDLCKHDNEQLGFVSIIILDIIHRPVLLRHDVSETEFSLRLHVKLTRMSPIERVSLSVIRSGERE